MKSFSLLYTSINYKQLRNRKKLKVKRAKWIQMVNDDAVFLGILRVYKRKAKDEVGRQ